MGSWMTVRGMALVVACATAVSAQDPALELEPAAAQEPAAGMDGAAPPVEVLPVEARPEDVSSLDAIVKAFYEVISGPAGEPRQWSRDRTLYIPGVHFVAFGVNPGEKDPTARIMEHQQYVDASDARMVRGGFYEREIHRVTRRFGNLVHVLSTYEARQTPDGPVQERGVNGLQLYFDGKRWWIAAVAWDVERPGNSIPSDLLAGSAAGDGRTRAAATPAKNRQPAQKAQSRKSRSPEQDRQQAKKPKRGR